jgi:hypothetical protein
MRKIGVPLSQRLLDPSPATVSKAAVRVQDSLVAMIKDRPCCTFAGNIPPLRSYRKGQVWTRCTGFAHTTIWRVTRDRVPPFGAHNFSAQSSARVAYLQVRHCRSTTLHSPGPVWHARVRSVRSGQGCIFFFMLSRQRASIELIVWCDYRDRAKPETKEIKCDASTNALASEASQEGARAAMIRRIS